ncbi:MAG: hypothetical protein PHR52_13570 [Fermentimonas sp.]|nr:hypothetical protein [Fermentimonas sp.]
MKKKSAKEGNESITNEVDKLYNTGILFRENGVGVENKTNFVKNKQDEVSKQVSKIKKRYLIR